MNEEFVFEEEREAEDTCDQLRNEFPGPDAEASMEGGEFNPNHPKSLPYTACGDIEEINGGWIIWGIEYAQDRSRLKRYWNRRAKEWRPEPKLKTEE